MEPRGKAGKREWLLRAGLLLLVLIGVVGSVLTVDHPGNLPMHQGRSVREWFAAFRAAGGHGQWVSGGNLEATEAFRRLGPDALPFLERMAHKRFRLQESSTYARVLSWLPRGVAKRLPTPESDSRKDALRLVALVGADQARAVQSSGSSVVHAVKVLTRALHKPPLLACACTGLAEIGPAAWQALPDLLELLSCYSTNVSVAPLVIQAIGALHFSASNAVPALTALVENSAGDLRIRRSAAHALGNIGQAARSSGGAVGRLFLEQELYSGRTVGLEMALATIGSVPGEAVPALEALCRDPQRLSAVYAAVALWDHDPASEQYKGLIQTFLKAPADESLGPMSRVCAGPVLASLVEYGTNALVFEAEISALAQATSSRAIFITNLATRALEEIRRTPRRRAAWDNF